MVAEATGCMVLCLVLCRRHTHTSVLQHECTNTDDESVGSRGVGTEHNCADKGAVASKLFVATGPLFVATALLWAHGGVGMAAMASECMVVFLALCRRHTHTEVF